MKNPMTPSGIEPATFRFVAQHLNHCATAVPDQQTYLFTEPPCTIQLLISKSTIVGHYETYALFELYGGKNQTIVRKPGKQTLSPSTIITKTC